MFEILTGLGVSIKMASGASTAGNMKPGMKSRGSETQLVFRVPHTRIEDESQMKRYYEIGKGDLFVL